MIHSQLKQNKENQYFNKLPSLEFKPSTKKRIFKRPSPSKSSMSNINQQDGLKTNNHDNVVSKGIFRSTVSTARENKFSFDGKSASEMENINQNGDNIKRTDHRRLTSQYDNRRVRRISNQRNMDLNLMPNIMTKISPSLTERTHLKKLRTDNTQFGKSLYQKKLDQAELNKWLNGKFHNKCMNQEDITTIDNHNFSQTSNESFHKIPDMMDVNLQSDHMKSNKQFYNTFSGHEIGLQGHTRNKSEGLNLAASANYDEEILKINKQENNNQNKGYNFIKNKKIKLMNKTMSLNSEVSQINDFGEGIKIREFQLGLCRGEDFFGKTYPARHIQSGFILCIKEVLKREVKNQLDKLLQYLKILSNCNSQYVIQIYGVFEERNKIYILMEYFQQGGLFLNLKFKKGTNIRSSLSYLKNVTQGVRELHNKDIVYRNFKPQNLSFIHDTCKISNLAWSCRLENQKNHYQGAIQYSSPELILGSKYTKKCDVWGLGVLFYQVINGVTPCYNLSRKKSTYKILNQNMVTNCEDSSHLRNLIQGMLKKQPELRMSIQQVLTKIELIQNELDGH